jgi:hypothetical protein
VRVEPAGHLRQAFGALGDVRADELRARVAREDAVALREQLGLREVRAVERPVGVRAQLLVAFVEAVDGLEEGVRVGGVEHDEDAQLARALEEGGQPLVVHAQQGAFRAAQAEPQILPNLQATRPLLDHAFEPPDAAREEAGLA